MEYQSFQSFDPNESNPPKRPVFLFVLCVLTFINTGMSLLSLLGSIFNGPLTTDQLDEQGAKFAEMAAEMRSANLHAFADVIDQLQRMTVSINEHFYLNLMISMVVLSIGIAGAILMLLGRKIGFHLYIAYSLMAIIQMYLFTSPENIPTIVVLFSLIFSAVFIIMYSRNLSWINAMEDYRTR